MNRKIDAGMRKGSASSGRVRMLGSERKVPHVLGRAAVKKVTLSRCAVDEYRRVGEQALRARLNHMEAEDQEGLDRLQSLADNEDFHAGDLPLQVNMVNMEDVLDGSERIELSHGGGEFSTLEEDLEADCGDDAEEKKARKVEDWRTRRNRTDVRNRAFLSQMPAMVAAYMRMCAEPEMPARPCDQGTATTEDEIYEIQVVDMFDTSDVCVRLDLRSKGVGAALVLEGLMPCAPWSPTVAIKIRVLEAYRITHARCPHLAIQSFVKSLCDIHGVAYRPYLCQQFSIAYNMYLDIRQQTDERVMKALGRDSSWRLKHTCPACTYKLEGEDKLIFEMLTMMDGNDSLKRVLRHEKASMAQHEAEEPTLAKSSKRADNREAGDGYYISWEKVDKWAKTRLGDSLPMQAGEKDSDNPCAERWKNMINDVTSKMWGIFDEMGIFLALCRHGFVLVIADMIRSGELAKYPLAVVHELLDAFGMKLGAGYDVGCHFESTIAGSEMGAEAKEKKLKCLVGSFHGHAHNRLCQLRFLATYVEGMGLEDLEGCEHFFSRSNGLAKLCRYASRFHRQQEITTYAKHFDSFKTEIPVLELSPGIGDPQDGGVAAHVEAPGGVDSVDRFHKWLAEEKTYLEGLKNAPKTNNETLEMEYVQRLVNLSASQAKLKVVAAEARRARGDGGTYAPGVSKAELARRRAQEKMENNLERVLDLEETLEIMDDRVAEVDRNGSGDQEAQLTKMNQSQTGYKMRKHIAKALQARSKAVKNAIERYNDAAAGLEPPMPSVSWEQVVEYAFLTDFNILRDTRAEVQSKPWSRPAYCLAMDRYFKTLRAREESKHLNIEIRRVVTWIRDKNRFLRRMERNLRELAGKSEEQIEEDTHMAVQ
ncbi:hypothetical protein K438DRAFT_1985345, partial [Mycena galopus ATCC 62051]